MQRIGPTLMLIVVATSAFGQNAIHLTEESTDARQSEWAPQIDEHVVEAGDTLWDLSLRVVGDPTLWPKVWSMNPEITNPHWIYPGDIIRFYYPTIELPTQGDMVAGPIEIPAPQDTYVDEIGVIEEEGKAYTGPKVEVVHTRVRTRPAIPTGTRFLSQFVSDDELEESAILSNAAPDSIFLTRGDIIYLDYNKKRPAVGDKMMIYRTRRQVRNPKTGSLAGYLTQITGFASITKVGDDVATARITRAVKEMERGQYATPYTAEPKVNLQAIKTTKEVEGIILAVRNGAAGITASESLVYINRGIRDGIVLGNRLEVISKGDSMTGKTHDMPPLPIALLHVVDAKQKTATCLVMQSKHEITPGNRVRTVIQ